MVDSKFPPHRLSIITWVLLGILLAVALALRAFHLNTLDIWWDEARNIFTASRPLPEIASAPELDIHPPLYFYLLHLWMQLVGTSEFVVRFFSLWFGVALVPLLFRLGTYIKDTRVGFWAAFLVALSPFFVDEAQQTRMYTLVLFLAILSFYLMLRAVNTGSRKFWALFALVATSSFYVHYSFIYILLAENTYLLFEAWRRWRARSAFREFTQSWIVSQVAIAFLYLFQLPNILREMQVYGNPGMTPPQLSEYALELVRAFLLGQKISAGQFELLGGLAIIALVLAFAGVVYQRRMPLINRNGVALLMGLIVPLVAYFIVLQKSPQFTPRYIMIATPLFYLFLALFWGNLLRIALLPGIIAGVLLLGGYASAWQSMYFDPAFANDDTRGLAQYISETATPDDLVLIDVPFPLGYYYRGSVPAHYLFVDLYTTADKLTQLAQNKKRIYWIQWYKSDTDPHGYVAWLLGKYAAYAGEKGLRGYNVTWYDLSRVTQFALAPQPQSASAILGEQIQLTGFAFGGSLTKENLVVDSPRLGMGAKPWVVLWWRNVQPIRAEYKVSVVLRDANDNTVAQDDRVMFNDRHFKTPLWSAQDTSINVYMPEYDGDIKPGEYTIKVIIYNSTTGERLRVGDGDTLAIGKINLVPAPSK